MSHKAEDITRLVNLYRSFAKYPNLSSARILKRNENDTDILVHSVWTQRNLEKGKTAKFTQHHVLKGTKHFDLLPIDISSELLCSFSPSEKYRAVLRTDGNDASPKKQYLEIWRRNQMVYNFDVAAFDVHGEIYADGEFGALEFSPDEKKIAYIAEKKLVKSEPYYKQKSQEAKKQTDATVEYNEFLYKPDWGEQLEGKHRSVIGICDLDTEVLSVLQGVPANYCPGQVIWSNDGNSLFGIALDAEPRQLGLIYCTNRKGCIFQLSLNNEFKILSDENQSVRSPKLSLDGNTLFWMQRPAGGPHDACQEIVKYDLKTGERTTLVAIQDLEGEFSGVYAHNFPKRCFSNDGKFLYFNTISKNKMKSYYVEVDQGKVTEVSDNEDGSIAIVDVSDNLILSYSTAFQRPHKLKISTIENLNWVTVSEEITLQENHVFKYYDFKAELKPEDIPTFNGLFYSPPAPSDGSKIPLLVLPHGGPHSAIANSFSFDVAYFNALGFAVLMVNYRGSLGCGQKFVDFLLGKIGGSDVSDMHTAVLTTLKEYTYLDENKVVVYGGSHGGFLSVHLTAQYPEFYKASAVRNPVIDVAVMYGLSDIPDWCSVEGGYDFTSDSPLTLEKIDALAKKSPMFIADKIIAPTLLLLGKKDLRVPCSQGITLYNLLKSRNIKTRVHVYDDNHPLAKPLVHMDSLITSSLWFLEHLGMLK